LDHASLYKRDVGIGPPGMKRGGPWQRDRCLAPLFFVADAAYSHRGEHLDRAVMSSHQRVIIPGVATVVLIGIGLSLV
jgi:hypothetical protein